MIELIAAVGAVLFVAFMMSISIQLARITRLLYVLAKQVSYVDAQKAMGRE